MTALAVCASRFSYRTPFAPTGVDGGGEIGSLLGGRVSVVVSSLPFCYACSTGLLRDLKSKI